MKCFFHNHQYNIYLTDESNWNKLLPTSQKSASRKPTTTTANILRCFFVFFCGSSECTDFQFLFSLFRIHSQWLACHLFVYGAKQRKMIKMSAGWIPGFVNKLPGFNMVLKFLHKYTQMHRSQSLPPSGYLINVGCVWNKLSLYCVNKNRPVLITKPVWMTFNNKVWHESYSFQRWPQDDL